MNCSAHSLASVIGNFEVGCGSVCVGGAALIRSNSVSYTAESHFLMSRVFAPEAEGVLKGRN